MRDWDDLRHFLAVARAGSTLAAAREIGVNQTTCARRVAALEGALGTRLFERHRAGYRLTEAGRRLVTLAERVEAEVAALAATVQADQRRTAFRLRVTAPDSLANAVLTPFLARFGDDHPALRVELIVADRKLALGRGEADIALRAGPQPETAGVVARRICGLGWTLYGTPAYRARHGLPRGVGDLAGHAVIGGEGAIARTAALRLLDAMPGVEVVSRSDSLANIAAAVASGLCLSALPCVIGDRVGLLRCFDPPAELSGDFWLVMREDLRRDPHARAFLDALVAFIGPLRPLLEGAEVASAAEPA